MALRFKPVDNVFYELLTESATRLVEGADILAEMLGESADLVDIAGRMRDAEDQADETTHEIAKRVNSTSVRTSMRWPPASTTSWTTWRRPST